MIAILAHLAFAVPASLPSHLRSAHFVQTTGTVALVTSGEVVLAETQLLLRGIVKTDLVGDIAIAGGSGEPSVRWVDETLLISLQSLTAPTDEAILRQGVAERVLQTDVLGSQPWAIKGLALWLSTVRHGDRVPVDRQTQDLRLGVPPSDFVFFNPQVAPPNGPAWIDTRELPALADLIAAGSDSFSDDKRGHLFAAGAWMLVAILMDKRLSHGEVLAHFAAGLRCAEPAAAAWAKAVGRNAAAIDKDYREQLVRHGPHLSSLVGPLPAANRDHPPTETLPTPQALTSDARERLKLGDNAAAQALLEKAVKLQPGCVRCLDTLGYAYFAQHRAPEAELAQARAAALMPHDNGVAERLAKYRGLREALGQKPLRNCGS